MLGVQPSANRSSSWRSGEHPGLSSDKALTGHVSTPESARNSVAPHVLHTTERLARPRGYERSFLWSLERQRLSAPSVLGSTAKTSAAATGVCLSTRLLEEAESGPDRQKGCV